MAATTTTTTTAASSTCTGNIWVLPTQDAACAVPASGNYSDIMKKCCSSAEVRSYDNDCGLYCLAQGQTVSSLLSCIQDNGATAGEFFCNANMSATATATATKTAESSSTKTSADSSASASNTDNAGVVNKPLSMSGLGVLAMLFCSTVVGVMA
ncbi:hypothetical protein P175DRAFT_0502442 [Aspergillus ochraceoroseus IBT 24754]|uniref:Uncharacterized protein n=2 Tax=Aspergillus ochraceoroseus TaxID=138278 RepID=A0A2T5LVI0_9EURO|nr:uncharacterized protein P175DRAFT_0502442 [Aspergillus ochraceoroseus IBT 24754]KKK25051.1 hypothetical protein AOCH_003734 [Aspergillus ochraceoroseus]PTU20298.1 hypothetical protein P175DRAFT_0502442 [Aspergillus ochraceoroseus IBT 24754]